MQNKIVTRQAKHKTKNQKIIIKRQAWEATSYFKYFFLPPKYAIHTYFHLFFKALCGPNWFDSAHCSLIWVWAICYVCFHIYIYQGPLKFWRRQAQTQQQKQSCSVQRIVYILSMLKVIFITQTRPKINTSSGLFGPCLKGAASVQNSTHIHFYKPVCLINSLRTVIHMGYTVELWILIIVSRLHLDLRSPSN